MAKLLLSLTVALGVLCVVPVVASAQIVNPVVDFGPSCAIEGSRTADDHTSTADDELCIVGKVVQFQAPLGSLDPNDPTKEYTYIMDGLISAGTTGGPFYSTQYNGGTFRIYCDDSPDADATYADKSTYTDGDCILEGSFSSFVIDTNTFTCAGAQNGTFQFTGGTLFNLVSDGGVGFTGINTGLFSVCSSQVPGAGCFGLSNTKLDVDAPVAVEAKTWGEMKKQFAN